jgi:hypothetical protein
MKISLKVGYKDFSAAVNALRKYFFDKDIKIIEIIKIKDDTPKNG